MIRRSEDANPVRSDSSPSGLAKFFAANLMANNLRAGCQPLCQQRNHSATPCLLTLVALVTFLLLFASGP
jgi:hypothetical protein